MSNTDKRGASRYIEDPKDLVIIGRDTKHASRAEHFLFDKRALVNPDEDFVQSVKDLGVQQDVWTRMNKETGEREVVAGRRRVLAARIAKVPVPTKRLVGGDVELMALSRLENSGRLEEDILSKAEAAVWLELSGMPHEDIASYLAWGIPMLKNALKALAVCTAVPELRAEVEAGRISPSAIKTLSVLPQEQILEKYREMSATATANGKGGKVTRAQAQAAATSSESKSERVVPPKRGLLVKILKKHDAGELELPAGTEDLSFWEGVKFCLGLVSPNRIKGMKHTLDSVAPRKRDVPQAAE